MREKLIYHLEHMEECAKNCEVESRSWHDFWVCQRELVQAMWAVLTWIVKHIDRNMTER